MHTAQSVRLQHLCVVLDADVSCKVTRLSMLAYASTPLMDIAWWNQTCESACAVLALTYVCCV